jgi:replicative DNA helicase
MDTPSISPPEIHHQRSPRNCLRSRGVTARDATVSRGDLAHLICCELEAVVLGTILQTGEPAYREVEFLTADDFAIEKHRIIFGAMRQLSAEVHPTIDAVSHCLIETGKLDAIGGLTGLVEIDEKGIPGIRLKGFGQSLRRKATDRRAYRLQEKLREALELGFSSNGADVRAIANDCNRLRAS